MRDDQGKTRAVSGAGIQFDSATMQIDHRLDDCQPQADSGSALAGHFDANEGLEDSLAVSWGDARPIIGN